MNIFQEIKTRLPITQVLEYYGVKFDRSNKAICPFHKEKTASLSILENKNKFKCFGCGAGGDSLDFVAKYFGLNLVESAKKINADFCIGLNTGKPSYTEISKYQAHKLESELFKEWENKAFDMLAKRHWQFRDYLQNNDVGSDIWVYACNKIDFIGYVVDMFIVGTDEEKISLKWAVDRIATYR